MNKNALLSCGFCFIFIFHAAIVQASPPRIWIKPGFESPAGFEGEEKARHYMQAHAAELGLPKDLKGIVLVKKRESLFATHFHFGQQVLGLFVDDAETIISIGRQDQSILRVFSNIEPIEAEVAVEAKLDSEGVLDIAWSHLRVHGDLTHPISSEELIWHSKKGPKRVFKTLVSVTKPFGHWEHIIDAETGEVLSVKNLHVSRKGEYEETNLKTYTQAFDGYEGPVKSRQEAMLALTPGFSGDVFLAEALKKEIAAGTGLIFDPDPRTRLGSMAIKDTSDASAFDGAYEEVALDNITKVGESYFLLGPWVSITDFDPPDMAPSFTKDGHWKEKRGKNSFNEVMTYYHLDQSQKYLQSLGYSKEKGIQSVSIHVDANGADGGDNSYYDPKANRMSFGHGCVDDNEDADVILHEYGHAIQRDINTNWHYGDTGAMGEGFGDYWAASYGYSTTNAKTFHPEKVFTWDGHNACWNGRVLDRTKARYEHKRAYKAHERLDGFISDELWSTPLFQSFKQLIDKGYSREEFDKIILESHFGLGAEVKMRNVADVMVETAKHHFPNKPYFKVLRRNFKKQGILPESLEFQGFQLTDSNLNKALDPGELAAMFISLKNVSRENLSEVEGVLNTTSKDISVSLDKAIFEKSAPNDIAAQAVPFFVALPKDIACGTNIPFELKLAYEGDEVEKQAVSFTTHVGQAVRLEAGKSADEKILDKKTLKSTFIVGDTQKTILDDFKVKLHIKHSYMGDIAVRLVSPTGKKRTLIKRGPGGATVINGSFPDELESKQPLSDFIGEPLDGEWTLEVEDNLKKDEGTLVEWGIEAVVDYECAPLKVGAPDA